MPCTYAPAVLIGYANAKRRHGKAQLAASREKWQLDTHHGQAAQLHHAVAVQQHRRNAPAARQPDQCAELSAGAGELPQADCRWPKATHARLPDVSGRDCCSSAGQALPARRQRRSRRSARRGSAHLQHRIAQESIREFQPSGRKVQCSMAIMCDQGSATSARSLGPRKRPESTVDARAPSSALLERAAPFGNPLVPEV